MSGKSSPQTNQAAIQQALYEAVLKNNVKQTQLLLEKGANPQNLLHLAAQNNSMEITIVLIAYGADVNEQNKENHLPVFYAAANGNTHLIECLMESGTHFSLQEGQAAIRVALFNNHPEAVLKLMEYGADPHVKHSKQSSLAQHSFLNRKHHSQHCNNQEIIETPKPQASPR